MRILMINKYNYIKGGSETYFFSLKKMLEEKGLETAVFSMKDKHNFSDENEDLFVEQVNYENQSFFSKIKNSAKLIYSKEAAKKLEKLIIKFKPDVAHLNLIYHQLTPSVIHVLKKYKIPMVLISHDYKIACPNYKMYTNEENCERCIDGSFINCTLNKCHKNSYFKSGLLTVEAYLHKFINSYSLVDYIVCPSEFMLETLKKSYIGKKMKDKLVLLPNFLDDQYKITDKDHLEDLIKVKENVENKILYFGRLSEEKGLDLLLKSKKKSLLNFELNIVGNGPLKDKLQSYVIEEKIRDVNFLGFMSGERLKQEIKSSKAVVLPAKWNEVFGLTNIESLALGTPVIGSNVGGIPDIIQDEKNGLIFSNGNVEELTTKIEKLICMGNEEYLSMVKECIDSSKKYNSTEYLFKITNIYNKAIKNYER